MKIVIIIPARLKSTRLPEKMIADLDGKPLVLRTYEQAKKSKLATDVIVAVDDKKIIGALSPFDCKTMLTPARLKSGSDRVAFIAKKMAGDVFVNVQGDEPLIEPKMIDQAIEPLLHDKRADCSTLVKSIPTSDFGLLQNPNAVKVALDRDGFALYFSRSPIPFHQNVEAQTKFYKHIGLYAYRRKTLLEFAAMRPSMLEQAESLEQLRLLENGYRIKCAITTLDSQAVDTLDDLDKVRAMLASRLSSRKSRR
jgi:3-deoxy-manno-octulosonate cytidylyltransferase (CMP-KDO synthetase)